MDRYLFPAACTGRCYMVPSLMCCRSFNACITESIFELYVPVTCAKGDVILMDRLLKLYTSVDAVHTFTYDFVYNLERSLSENLYIV